MIDDLPMKTKFKHVAVSLFVLLFSAQNLVAQNGYDAIDVQEWESGVVILITGDTVSGAIAYHCKEDVIEVLKEDKSISTFSPVNVSYFVVNNNAMGEQQTFKTLYWDQGKTNSDFKKTHLL